jgi:hypothetical protein
VEVRHKFSAPSAQMYHLNKTTQFKPTPKYRSKRAKSYLAHVPEYSTLVSGLRRCTTSCCHLSPRIDSLACCFMYW